MEGDLREDALAGHSDCFYRFNAVRCLVLCIHFVRRIQSEFAL